MGLIFRQFDALENHERPWEACEQNCHCKLYELPGKALTGRLSAMIAYQGLRTRTDRKGISLPYADRAGYVLRNEEISLQCAYGKDAATYTLDNPANPGCSDQYCSIADHSKDWQGKPCGFHDYHGPAYPPSLLKVMLERFAEHGEKWLAPSFHSGYNEIIVNSSHLNTRLPHAIEAFFVMNSTRTGKDGLGIDVRAARRAFLEMYKIPPSDVPLLLLNPLNWESPFSILDDK